MWDELIIEVQYPDHQQTHVTVPTHGILCQTYDILPEELKICEEEDIFNQSPQNLTLTDYL